jgi:putative transposase
LPRSKRRDYEGAWHHVMNRGLARAAIFGSDEDRLIFLDSLALAGHRFGVEVHAYCLMGNHYHLLVRSRSGRLAQAMQLLSSRYTQRLNYRDGFDGPRFRGRYTSFLVNSDAQLLRVHRYIHLNPVNAGLCLRAEDWRWSSASVYLGLAPPPEWLVTAAVLAMFGGEDPQRSYREFLEAGVDGPTMKAYRFFDQEWWESSGVRPAGSDPEE